MKKVTPVGRAPFVRMLPGSLHKIVERIILHYPATQLVESGIRDHQGGFAGRIAKRILSLSLLGMQLAEIYVVTFEADCTELTLFSFGTFSHEAPT